MPLVFGISQHREAGQVEGLQGGHVRQPRGRERSIHRLLDQIAFFVLQSPQMLNPAILIKNVFHNIISPGPRNDLLRRRSPSTARLPIAGIGNLGVLLIAPIQGLIAVQQKGGQRRVLVKGVGVIHSDLPLAVGILQQAQDLLAVMDKYRRGGIAPFRVSGFREARVALFQAGGKQFGFSLCGIGAWQSEDAQQEGQQQGKAFHGDSSLSGIWEFIHRTIGKVKILQRGWGNLALLPEKISAEVSLKGAASSKTPLALAHGS